MNNISCIIIASVFSDARHKQGAHIVVGTEQAWSFRYPVVFRIPLVPQLDFSIFHIANLLMSLLSIGDSPSSSDPLSSHDSNS